MRLEHGEALHGQFALIVGKARGGRLCCIDMRHGSITFVFAPSAAQGTSMRKTPQIQLQNYGAKDMVHNNAISLVFAT